MTSLLNRLQNWSQSQPQTTDSQQSSGKSPPATVNIGCTTNPQTSSTHTASLLARLFTAAGKPNYRPTQGALADALHRSGVCVSSDLSRIKALPRRPETWDNIPDLTPVYLKPSDCSGCQLCRRGLGLRKPQSVTLYEAAAQNGALCPIGVGWGKTLLALLLPDAMQSKRAVILVQPDLREQLIQVDIPLYGRHYKIPAMIDGRTMRAVNTGFGSGTIIVAYSQLSTAKSHDILDHLAPDLIISDECHNLRHRSAARTKRFMRYMKAHPECRLVAMSGSMTTRSIKDFAHLSELALRNRSPVPGNFRELEDWAAALDVSPDPMHPGELIEAFCDPSDTGSEWDRARSGFRRRFVQTPGVIATDDGGAGMSLVIQERKPPDTPDVVKKALKNLFDAWTTPDGEEELEDALAIARIARQLSNGFYYHWVWPDGLRDEEWLDARKNWHRAIRQILSHRARPGLDSPLLVARAAERGELDAGTSVAWREWCAVKARPAPPTEAVWLSDWLVTDACKWAAETSNGIIWYEHEAIGRAVSEAGIYPLFAGGVDSENILKCRPVTDPHIVASIKAHGTGKNLQAYCNNLVTTPPGNGTRWEQMLGRTHRPGQESDSVNVWVYLHTPTFRATWENALNDAEFVEKTQGSKQKLLQATRLVTA